MDKHWEEARVVAKLLPRQQIEITAKNVSRLSIDLPKDQAVLNFSAPMKLQIGDDTLSIDAVPSGTNNLKIHLVRSEKGWSVSKSPSANVGLVKRPGLQGPIDDAFMDSFVFVGPTSTSANNPIEAWASSEYARAKVQWRKHYRGEVRERTADNLTSEEIAQNNLVLFGTPDSNPLIAKILKQLPITWSKSEVAIGAHRFSDGKHAPILIYPNPLNPKRYVVINSGFTFREYAYLNNARQIPMLPDWAIVNVTEGVNKQQPGKIDADGFFDEQWQVSGTR